MNHFETPKTLTELNALLPETMQSVWQFDDLALRDGAIPSRYKELMALAVACNEECANCIEMHTRRARKLGASNQEIAESVMVALALRAGRVLLHGISPDSIPANPATAA